MKPTPESTQWQKPWRVLSVAILLVGLSGLFSHPVLAQSVANWTGAGDGINYSDPANWSGGVVPINAGTSTFNVIVPNGKNITFDVAGSISGISYGSGGSITISTGVAFNVNGVASLGSNIFADGTGTIFTANGVGVALGSNVRTVASNGAYVATSANSYTSNVNITAFHADGSSSLIEGQSINTITNSGGASTFLAENNGVIDFSNVQTIMGSGNTFTIRTGGEINFDNLQTVAGRFNIEIPQFDLPSVTTSNGMVAVLSGGTVLNTPQLVVQTGSSATIPNGATWNAGSLTTLDNTTLNISLGGNLNAPNLANFRNSTITIEPGIGFNAGPLTNVDNSRIAVLGGSQLSVGTTNFTRSIGNSNTAFRADGVGSKISALSMVSINNTSGLGGLLGQQFITTFLAENGGVLDFSNLQSIDGGFNGSDGRSTRNVFAIRTGGQILLDNLQTISQLNTFDIAVPQFDLPSLQTSGGLTVNLSVGSVLNTPQLVSQNGTSATISVFSVWNAGSLTTLDGTTLNIGVGGMLNAPNLVNFNNSAVTLEPGVGFNVGSIETVDNSRIGVVGGTQLSLAATNFTRSIGNSNIAFLADGVGSEISALSMVSINNTSGLGGLLGQQFTTTFRAENGGLLDFKNVHSIDGGFNGSDGRSTQNLFNARSGGSIALGDVETTGKNYFTVDGPNSSLLLEGLRLNSGSTLSATALGKVQFTNRFEHSHTVESNVNLDNGRVAFVGSGISELEIAGENLGLSTNGLNNFGFQQLQIGALTTPTTLILADRINNGNRTSGNSEVQYLLDVNGQGLIVNLGSRLILNGYDMLVSNGTNSFFSIRDQFQPGEITVQYQHGNGYISLTGDRGEIFNSGMDGDLRGYRVIGPGMAKIVMTPGDENVLEMIAGSPVEIMQNVSFLDEMFRIEFDAMALDSSGTLSLILDGDILQTWDWSELGSSNLQTMSYLVSDQNYWGSIDVPLSLHWDANTGDSVWIDNWRMVSAVPEPGNMLVLMGLGMAFFCRRRRQ